MGYTALERIFVTERHRQRAAPTGPALPAMQEVQVAADSGPYLATNMRNTFLAVRRGSEGVARYGFSSCTVEGEDDLLSEFYQVLESISVQQDWDNRCTSVEAAIQKMAAPKTVVVPGSFLGEVCGEDVDLGLAQQRMSLQGYVAMVNGMQVLLADLPEGTALVVAAPATAGTYTRVGDHVGILAQRVDSAFMVVG